MTADDVCAIIPALNEAETIAGVIADLQQQGIEKICVVDNGSCDRTAEIAQQAGAQVVVEPVRGYGQACWRGLQMAPVAQSDWILFCDGDGSDDLGQLPELLELRSAYDLILGNRRGTVAGRSQLTAVQNFGNWLATRLIAWGWGQAYEDLGPLRLIRRQALERLAMADRGFGWTVEMQAKAAGQGLSICERPVNYRPRQGGQSKIAGTVRGSVKAGQVILTTLAVLYWQKTWQRIRQRTRQRTRQSLAAARSAVGLWGARLGRLIGPLIGPPVDLLNRWRSPQWQRALLWIAALLLVVGSVQAAPYGDFLNQPQAVPQFWWGAGVMGLGFGLAWGLQRVTGGWFWGVAIAPRLILLAMYPGDDIWRYLWEGYLQTQGINPYLLAPNADSLIPLRFDWWAQINHLDHAAIYPPLAQLGFRLLASISLVPWLFKLAFVAADLAICQLLSQRFGHRLTLLYAWNPLIIYSFAGGGHYDSWFLLPLVAAWLLGEQPDNGHLCDRPPTHEPARFTLWQAIGSAWCLGLSIAIKWMSLPVLAFWLWYSRRQGWLLVLLAGLLPLGLATLPFCDWASLSCPVIPLGSDFVTQGRSAALLQLQPIGCMASRWAGRWDGIGFTQSG
ncbi:MAG: glycosyltransferase family 2 protein [Phormidesmis sp. RL_2_1]|nr:glycosyltransferase family 2 protein [Phormidesmis sp. RL_2_1]